MTPKELKKPDEERQIALQRTSSETLNDTSASSTTNPCGLRRPSGDCTASSFIPKSNFPIPGMNEFSVPQKLPTCQSSRSTTMVNLFNFFSSQKARRTTHPRQLGNPYPMSASLSPVSSEQSATSLSDSGSSSYSPFRNPKIRPKKKKRSRRHLNKSYRSLSYTMA